MLDGWSHQQTTCGGDSRIDFEGGTGHRRSNKTQNPHLSPQHKLEFSFPPGLFFSRWFFSTFSSIFCHVDGVSVSLFLPLPTSLFQCIVHSQGSAAMLDGLSHQKACCDSSLGMRWKSSIRASYWHNEMWTENEDRQACLKEILHVDYNHRRNTSYTWICYALELQLDASCCEAVVYLSPGLIHPDPKPTLTGQLPF